MEAPFLTVRSVARWYGPIRALTHADLTLVPGEIHGLVGENGAGKSTLVRVIAGIEDPDSGSIDRTHPDEPRPVRLAVVPQYPRLAEQLPVWQNLIVGNEPRWGPFLAGRRGLAEIEEIAQRYDIALDLTKPAGELGATEIRLAALLAALAHHPEVLILDEPTVGLTVTDQSAILNTLRRFRDDNHSVLYISHDLTEVCTIADRVTPLMHGETGKALPAPVSPEELATILFGDIAPAAKNSRGGADDEECAAAEDFPEATPEATRQATPEATPQATREARSEASPGASSDAPAEPSWATSPELSRPTDTPATADAVLRCDHAVIHNTSTARHLGPLTIEVAAGKITAITGVRESGLDLIEQYLSGEATLEAGTVRVEGRRLNSRVDPARLRRRNVAFIPSDRFDSAAALSGSVEENAILQERATVHPRGFRTSHRAHGITTRLLDTFGIHVSQVQPLWALSGGTIQKLILARELDRQPTLCIIAEPTAGLDLQSQISLKELLTDLAARGSAVIVLSSSIRASQLLADVIYVLHDGALAGTFTPDQEQEIARAFAGIAREADAPVSAEGGCL
ncbi:MAG: ATP-binding cassette domain-containing protein [Alkalispirochaeta sp.]